MTKMTKISLGMAAALAAAPAAYAHGDHSVSFVATAIHWLSSPAHSLFAVIGGVAVSALIIRKARASAK